MPPSDKEKEREKELEKERQWEKEKLFETVEKNDKPKDKKPSKFTFSLTANMDDTKLDNILNKKKFYEDLTKDEASHIFMEMLKEKGIPASTKWEQCQKLIQSDERYNVIKAIGEKKRVFNDYIQKTKKAERNEARTKLEQAKENFMLMLKGNKRLTSGSKFHKVGHFFMGDTRWKGIEERERENLFQDYLDEIYNKEKEEARTKRKQFIEKFKEMLMRRETTHSNMKWEECQKIYAKNYVFEQLSNYDQLTAFSEVIIELEQKEIDEKRKEKRTKERKNREAFRELLQEHIEKNTLNHKTKWKDFVHSIQYDTRLWNMLGQSGSTPHELFEDQIDLLKDEYKKIKEVVKSLVKVIYLK